MDISLKPNEKEAVLECCEGRAFLEKGTKADALRLLGSRYVLGKESKPVWLEYGA